MKINKYKILVSSQMGIGNFIMFIPFLYLLRNKYPYAHIALVFTNSKGAAEFASTLKPIYFNEIILLNSHHSSSLVKFLKGFKLSLRFWDKVFFRFNTFRREVLFASVTSSERIGHFSNFEYANKFDWILTKKVEILGNYHEIDINLSLLDLVYNNNFSVFPKLYFNFDLNDASEFIEFKSSKCVIVVPGTSVGQKWKRWPFNNWVKLIRELINLNYKVVIVGAIEEMNYNDDIYNNFIIDNNVTNLTGKLSLIQMIKLLNVVKCVIGNDSGIAHISASLSLKTLVFFGPTDVSKVGIDFYTSKLNTKILKSSTCLGSCYRFTQKFDDCDPEKCMENISVDDALSNISQLF